MIDLRTLAPFDDATVSESVRRTGRAIVVHEASGFCGYGAEVAARLTESCFHHLEAPILRVTGLDIPYPPPDAGRSPPAKRRPDTGRDRTPAVGRPRRPAGRGALVPDFRLPDLGEGLTEAEIIRWLVGSATRWRLTSRSSRSRRPKRRSRCRARSPGRCGTLHGAVGDTVAVGAALLTIDAATAADGGQVLVGYGISDAAGRTRRSRPARRGTRARPAPEPGSSPHSCAGWPTSTVSMSTSLAAPARTASCCVTTSSR